jgi:uncharacterized protein YyaL (SSP411 family)
MGGERLADATSPYLRQHADNPVEWYPWGDEAFEVARDRDVPVFLSVGYAACHWCHVMAHESFEDPATTGFLNEHFVSVKVDREERPDVDGIYMVAVQSMTGQGGWPMSVFLTPEREPFWAATYLPDQPRHGMPSFRQVLEALAEAWRSRRTDIVEQGSAIASAIQRANAEMPAATDGRPPDVSAAMRSLAASFDERWGGFGPAPKFPQPPVLEWLLRRALRGDDPAERMVVKTLHAIADGGIHDHVTGGFARYSTDAAWHVPHFEKMLYDNAQLVTLYTRAWLHTRDARFADVAGSTARALIETFGLADGGFASSTDADSDGREGAFATWTWGELLDLVGPAVAEAFGAVPEGNWEGTNVLWRPVALDLIAERHGLAVDALRDDLRQGVRVLAERRSERPQPGLDDKVVASWNGLAITGLATAGRALGDRSYVAAAERAATFVWNELRVAGRLQRAWRDGRTSGPAFLDDHALLGIALLTLFETTGEQLWFDRARELCEAILDLFWRDGGVSQVGRDAASPVVTPRERSDDVTPSGAFASAELFVRMTHLTGDASPEDRARAIVAQAGHLPERAPTAFGQLWTVLDMLEGPFKEIAIVGDPGHSDIDGMADVCFRDRYIPNAVVALGYASSATAAVPILDGRPTLEGKATAYVCERFVCALPVTSPEALAAQLQTS